MINNEFIKFKIKPDGKFSNLDLTLRDFFNLHMIDPTLDFEGYKTDFFFFD